MKTGRTVAGILIVLILSCGIIVWVNRAILNKAEAEMIEYLQVDTSYTAKTIKNLIEGEFTTLVALAAFAGSHEEFDLDHLLPLLRSINGAEEMRRMGIILPDGKAVGALGNTFDASEADYFLQAMLGDTYVSPTIIDRFTGLPINVFSTPIYHEGQIVAVLFSTRESEDFKDSLGGTEQGESGGQYLINSKGNAIFNDDTGLVTAEHSNAFENMAEFEFADGFSLEQLKVELSRGEDGLFEYKVPGSKDVRYACYEPLGILDWYVLAVIPELELTETFSRYKSIIFSMGFSLAFLVALLAVVILLEQRGRTKIIGNHKEMLEMIVSNMQGAVSKHLPDEAFTFTYMNEGFLRMTGYEKKEIEELLDNKFANMVVVEDLELLHRFVGAQLKPGTRFNRELHIYDKDKQRLTIHFAGIVMLEEADRPVIYCTMIDITEKQQILKVLAEKTDSLLLNEMSFQLAILNADMMMFDYFPQRKRIEFADFMIESSNLPNIMDNVPQGIFDLGIIAEESYEVLVNGFKGIDAGEQKVVFVIKVELEQGQELWEEITLTSIVVNDGKVEKAIGLIHDVTKDKKRQDWLEAVAQTDQMTGIYNKTATEAMICELFYMLSQRRLHVLMVIDIDDFKGVNDQLGHAWGDRVLIEISSKLKQLFGSDDILGRIGGDEFMVFVKDLRDMEDVAKKAQDVCLAFASILAGKNRDYKVLGSVGVAVYGRDGTTFAELYNKADAALYSAKHQGKNKFCIYEPEAE